MDSFNLFPVSFKWIETYSVSVRETTDEGTKVVQPNDCFNIFKLIPGTPAFWKAFRNDILKTKRIKSLLTY